jgi:Subtilase family
MNSPSKRAIAAILIFLAAFAGRASYLDTIGVTLLRAVTTNLDGAGIRVAQAEAQLQPPPTNAWEINPANVHQPTNLFTYLSADGSTNVYPNNLGTNSWHAEAVANAFYGMPYGVATNVAHVDNYEADYFFNDFIAATIQPAIGDPVVNQSFVIGQEPSQVSVSQQQTYDSDYDNYAANYGTLFISPADNLNLNARVSPPGTAYNCICVGACLNGVNYSSIGPTLDNGRCKPDITAPTNATSFSTPMVAGAATVLIQAGLRGDGGSDTNSAVDMRTVKALLMNGAVKPANWTNSTSSPLDARYGAGVLNIFNSYEQLVCGKHGYIASTSGSTGNPHPPTGATDTIDAMSGWDFNTNSSGSSTYGVKHYCFNVTNDVGGAMFTATATLVWNRHYNAAHEISPIGINNLDLFLYDAANSNLMAASTSVVDNVEHIYIPELPQGRYDLQVLMNAGGVNPGNNSEPYALAWEFFSQTLSATKSGTNVTLNWPVYPAGFVAEAATNLVSPIVWKTGNLPLPVVTNGENIISFNPTNGVEFFRLRRP